MPDQRLLGLGRDPARGVEASGRGFLQGLAAKIPVGAAEEALMGR